MKSKIYRFLSALALLALLHLACDNGETGRDLSLWARCPDLDHDVEVCSPCFLVSQRVEGKTRYFRFYDSEEGEVLQSSVSADCTLVEKSQ